MGSCSRSRRLRSAHSEEITDYVYHVLCDGEGLTVDAHTTEDPLLAYGCEGSSYQVAAVINGTWETPYSPPVTVDPLAAPTLDGAE